MDKQEKVVFGNIEPCVARWGARWISLEKAVNSGIPTVTSEFLVDYVERI